MDITLERILSLLPHKPDGTLEHGARKEFAQSIGLKNGNLIADWMRGRTSSYTNYLYEIAAKYDVSVEWLRGETDEKKPAAPKDDELGELIALLRSRPELRRLVRDFEHASLEEVQQSGILFELFSMLTPEQQGTIIAQLRGIMLQKRGQGFL